MDEVVQVFSSWLYSGISVALNASMSVKHKLNLTDMHQGQQVNLTYHVDIVVYSCKCVIKLLQPHILNPFT